MFIHLGGDVIIRVSEIVAIFDLATERTSKISEQFFKQAVISEKVIYIEKDEVKSFILTEKKIYYSPISSSTLKKRANFTQHLELASEAMR
jgi:hypothetical protein